MFIRQVKKQNSKEGAIFYQYQLVQASRIDGKVKQTQVLYLGSDKDLDNKDIRNEVLEQLQAKIFKQNLLRNDYSEISQKLTAKFHEKYLIKYTSDDACNNKVVVPQTGINADFQAVNIDEVSIENNKTFGAENLCKQISEKLDLTRCFDSIGLNQNDNILAQISVISRCIFSASEYKTSQYLADSSSLKDLFNIPDVKISHQSLYKISDKLYQNKTKIDKFLYAKILNIFNIDDSIVIYDLSNTHFEGRKEKSKIAQFGRNKQKRNDCKQVVFTGIINPAGFIRHSRIYEGNKADIATVEDMVADLEAHADNPKGKTIVLDAGFASEENLKFLDDNGYKYICVSRQKLNDEAVLSAESKHTVTDRLGSTIGLSIIEQEKFSDTWMCIKSEQKRVKEESMMLKLCDRFEEEMQSIANALEKKGGTKKTEKVWERIGRCKEKNRNVSGRYNVEVADNDGVATEIKWEKKQAKPKEDSKHGVYFIRTNIENPTEQQLWDTYNLVREVEASFKCLKSDLNIRPVHHQNDDRIEAHIYLTTLAYQLVNCVRHMLKDKDINHDWTNIVRIMNTQSLQEVVMPMKTKTLRITTSSKPIEKVSEIYKATNTKSMINKKQKYVVYH